MSLEQKLEEDLKTAMKAKDTNTLGTLRMAKAAITNHKIAQKAETLADADIVQILQKQAKQRQESIASYEKAGRPDLLEKEKSELSVLEKYLPKQLSDTELQSIVEEVIKSTGASSKADMGRIMKELMPRIKGQADGKRVNTILAKILN